MIIDTKHENRENRSFISEFKTEILQTNRDGGHVEFDRKTDQDLVPKQEDEV